MKHFNKFKDQLRAENTELPEGLSWNDMEEGILNKMGNESIKPKNETTGNKAFFISLAAVICALFIFLVYMHFTNSAPVNSSITKAGKKEAGKSEKNSSELFVPKDDLPNLAHIAKSAIDLDQSQTSAKNLSTIESQNQSSKSGFTQDLKTQNGTKEKIDIENKIDLQNGKINQGTPEISQKININKWSESSSPIHNLKELRQSKSTNSGSEILPTSFANDQNTSLKNNALASNADQIDDNDQDPKYEDLKLDHKDNENSRPIELNECATLPLINTRVANHKNETPLNGPKLDINPVINPATKRLWNIELSSGWNTWNYGLSNIDNSSALYQDTHSEYGFSYSTRIGRQINDKISLTSGIDLDFLYKRLEVSYNNYKNREVKNVLLSYSLNSITGQKTNPVFGDTTVVDTIVKSLTDFNKFQVIQIPLIVNYQIFSNHSWRLEAGVGPTISMLINYNGKYLENDVLHTYGKNERIYNTSPKIALNANIMLNKKLEQNYYVGIRADFRNHFSSWSIQSDDAIKPKIISGLITIGKSF